MLTSAQWEELDGLVGDPAWHDHDGARRCAERVNTLLHQFGLTYSLGPRLVVVTEATRRLGEPYPTAGVERWVLDHEVRAVDAALREGGHGPSRTPRIRARAESLRSLAHAMAKEWERRA